MLTSHDSRVRLRRAAGALLSAYDHLGEQAGFYATSLRYIPFAATRYRTETVRLTLR